MNLLSTTSTKIYLPKTDFGNLSSIIFFLNHLGFTTEILPINDLYLLQSEYILIPGNGNWCSYYHSGLVHYLKYNTSNRYIGICGGMQIMFASSEENPELPGSSRYLNPVLKLSGLTPNLGFREIAGKSLYFANSYGTIFDEAKYPIPNCINIDTYKSGDNPYIASIVTSNLVGFQYHPEVSKTDGFDVFLNLTQHWF